MIRQLNHCLEQLKLLTIVRTRMKQWWLYKIDIERLFVATRVCALKTAYN
jgi:hypothetical protein